MKEDKIQKLIEISRLYYEQDKTQNEIAKQFQVSRPLVSRMLKEAKDMGIVKIEIRYPVQGGHLMLIKIRDSFCIEGGVIIPNSINDNITNDDIVKEAIRYMADLGQMNYGIGWGHIIGNLINYMEKGDMFHGLAKKICPLIGNSGVGNRNYHSNELVRIFSIYAGAEPEYLYAPALVLSEQELCLVKELENYKLVLKAWENLDAALVNIGNYPSVPDFASAARYGDMLNQKKAVGRILNYYYDIDGNFLHSPKDYSLQIPLEILAKSPHVIGICSSNTKPAALLGAMKTGLVKHLIAPEDTVKALMELNK